jgi:hypothetical protein
VITLRNGLLVIDPRPWTADRVAQPDDPDDDDDEDAGPSPGPWQWDGSADEDGWVG